MGCCCKRDNESEYGSVYDEDSKKTPRWLCVVKWILIVLVILLLVGFIVIFVVLPIVLMESIELQRLLMFPNFDQPENPQYNNYELYGAVGVLNRYVSVIDTHTAETISLGVWQVVPEIQIEESKDPNFSFDDALSNTKMPIVIYFHGNSGTRIYPYPTYKILRKFFHVLAFDYRSYGDSTEALLAEPYVVNDALQLYQWVLEKVGKNVDVYLWGHSLGTALSTHTVKLIMENMEKPMNAPKGLMLEAPFTTMREEIEYHPLGKIFAWLPWFDATIRDPLEDNGFYFRTTTNILSVECPIMIMHAEDDSIIPYTLGRKLYQVASNNNKTVLYHQVPAKFKSDHLEINKWDELPNKIQEFLDITNGKRPKNSTT